MLEYCRLRSGIRSLAVEVAIFQTLGCFVLPIVYSSLSSTRDSFVSTPERLADVVSFEAYSGQQQLTKEPTHLSLGTGLYRIADRRGEGAGVGSCLGRRKRIENNEDRFVQCAQYQGRIVEPPDSAYSRSGGRRLIQRFPNVFMSAKSRKMDLVQGANNRYEGLPQYIVEYFIFTEQPRNKFIRNSDHWTPPNLAISLKESSALVADTGVVPSFSGRFAEAHDHHDVAPVKAREIIYLRMSAYYHHKNKHVEFPAENDNRKRYLCIAKAHDHLGSREISDLNLQEKEIQFAKELLGMGTLGDFSAWSPTRFCSVIVDVIGTVRTTLYRIRKLDEMCQPPLFDTVQELKDAQKEAFELLKTFWVKHTFPAVANKEARDKMPYAKRDSLETLFESAQKNVASRCQSPTEKISLSWIVFEYWVKKRLPTISNALCDQLGLVIRQDKRYRGSILQAVKTYLADQAVVDALKAGILNSEYQIIVKTQFKLRIE